MNTKQLTQALNRLDPDGNIEIVCEGSPIAFVEKLPAYYDGDLMSYKKDEMTITDKGEKIRIHLMSIPDFLELHPSGKIIFNTRDSSIAYYNAVIAEAKKSLED